MTAPTTTAEAETFLADVERELADLPREERDELLEDLATHLAALEEEPDERSLTQRLGTPTAYAAELRAAAGLPPRSADGTDDGRLVNGTRAIRRIAVTVGETKAVRELLSFLPQLRPAWWVLRGYLVVLLPRLWRADGRDDFPVPTLLGSHVLGALAVAVLVVASVQLGRRQLPRLGIVLVLALDLLVAGAGLQQLHTGGARVAQAAPSLATTAALDPFVDSPLISLHGPVTNVFPYTSDGKPLDGVLLFDQDGRPLLTGQQQWWADECRRIESPPRAADGVPVPFSYPKPYILDPAGGTLNRVAPTAGQCAAVLARPGVPLPTFPKPAAKASAKPAPKPGLKK